MRTWLTIGAALLLACGSSSGSSSDPDAGPDAASEAATEAGPDGGLCCPPDPHPGCCMDYGGWSETGQCYQVCDGMPQPSDPGWSLVTDGHGCSTWTNPKPTGGPGTCGAASFDAGTD